MTWETTTEHQNEKRKSSMLQPKIQPSDGLSFRTCTVFIFMVLQSVGEPSQLICSHQPIVALAGDDVILTCHLEPPINVSSETVIWTRPGLDPKYIHVHRDGRTVHRSQNPSYHYRTRLFVDELKNGNVSMKIFRVKLSDAGKYFCILSSMMKEASIQLTVGAASDPSTMGRSIETGGMIVVCEAKGWYPEPELFWLDGEGNLLSAGPTETVRGPDDLYTVSRRLTVRKSDSFTCRVQQKNINQTRETHVYVPEDFFKVQSLRQPEFIILIIIISTIIFTLCCICIAFLVASVQNLLYKRNNGEHHVKQVMLNIQERPKVKKRDAKEAAHELRPMLKRKKQQEEQQEQQEEQREQLEEQREQLEGQREQPEEQREQPEEQREQPEEQREQLEGQREQPEEQREQLEEQREQLEGQREQLEGQREQSEEQREQLEEQQEQLEEEREQREQLEEQQEQLEEQQEQLEEQQEQL